MAASSQQRVTVFFFRELASSEQLRIFEHYRNVFQEKWGHLLAEDGQWWGREVGKHERVWEVVFWKDEHSHDAVNSDPEYLEHTRAFFKDVALPDSVIHNVPVYGSRPFREVLEAGVNFVAYCQLGPGQSPSEWVYVAKRFSQEVEYPGWQGGAYISPIDAQGEALSFGAWDSVEANEQLFTDGRFTDLMESTNEMFDGAARTFNSHVKFYKHGS